MKAGLRCGSLWRSRTSAVQLLIVEFVSVMVELSRARTPPAPHCHAGARRERERAEQPRAPRVRHAKAAARRTRQPHACTHVQAVSKHGGMSGQGR